MLLSQRRKPRLTLRERRQLHDELSHHVHTLEQLLGRYRMWSNKPPRQWNADTYGQLSRMLWTSAHLVQRCQHTLSQLPK